MRTKNCKYTLLCGTLSLCFIGGVLPMQAIAQTTQSAVEQQTTAVTGVVTDATGPVIGASVIEKGNTTNGTITDLDGKFTLNVRPGATLVISYIGYKTVEIAASKKPLKIVMSEDSKVLKEVVVTALGIKRERKALGYGVDEVKGEALTKAKETNVINSMAGLCRDWLSARQPEVLPDLPELSYVVVQK